MADNQNGFILEAVHVTKIYGRHNIPAAKKLLDEGLGKEEIFFETGCTTALSDVSFKVHRGEIFVIIGLSGSGKSTIIRCFNKLVSPTSGHVVVDGKTVNQLTKNELTEFRRKTISMVFQHFGLFTHRSVRKNVAYGLEVRGVPKPEREARAREYIELVGLHGLEHSAIRQLSGGMKQRVGLARALCNDPDVLLMDEPFSALDPLVRSSMQDELLAIQKKLNKTILFITHDIDEAFKLGNRVAIMRDGKIIQTGTPGSLLTCPADDYVKNFVGNTNRPAVLTAGMIMQSAAIVANCEDDESILIATARALEQGHPYAYLVDSRSKLIAVLPARECTPGAGKRKNPAPVTVSSDTKVKDLFPIAAETPYPLPVLSPNGVLLGIVSKASLLKVIK